MVFQAGEAETVPVFLDRCALGGIIQLIELPRVLHVDDIGPVDFSSLAIDAAMLVDHACMYPGSTIQGI